MTKTVYIADCTPGGGILVFDLVHDTLLLRQRVPLDRPMYLAVNGSRLHAIARAPFANSPFSGILTYPVNPDGLLGKPGDPVSTDGVVSCHLCVWHDAIYDANYLSGSVNKLGVKTVTHSGSGPNLPRQDGPHVHFTAPSPDGKYLLACDLGLDTIFVYDSGLNPVSRVRVPAGHGVRHLAFSEDGKTVYSVNELASTLSVFSWQDGMLTCLDTVPALPEGFTGTNTAAAIRISGDTLWVSHRGFDGIAEFDIRSRIPVLRDTFSSGGHSPRDFAVTGGVLIVTNEGGCITVLDRADHSILQSIPAGSPLCVLIVEKE